DVVVAGRDRVADLFLDVDGTVGVGGSVDHVAVAVLDLGVVPRFANGESGTAVFQGGADRLLDDGGPLRGGGVVGVEGPHRHRLARGWGCRRSAFAWRLRGGWGRGVFARCLGAAAAVQRVVHRQNEPVHRDHSVAVVEVRTVGDGKCVERDVD